MKQIDFSGENTRRNMIRSVGPMLIAQVLNLLYSIVDRVYIGRVQGEGTLALGGIGICFPVIILITAFTNLYGVGGAPLCAIERGKGERDEAERIMNQSFRLLILTGVILMIIGLIFCEPILYLFGASDVTIKYAASYLRIYLIGTLASMTAAGLNPFINAQGYALTGMLTIFIGTVANIILDPIFIFVFGMGVAGAAIATVISQCLSAFYVIAFLRGSKAELKLIRHTPFDRKLSANIISLGFASFVMQCTNSVVSIVCNHVLSQYGDLYVSAMTIVSSVRQILDTPVGAIADGASPMLSFNYGARRYSKVRYSIRLVTTWAVGYTIIIWALILLFPAAFIGIFNSEPTLLGIAIPALHMYFFAFVFQAFQYSGQTVFKSLNKKKRAIFFSLFRKIVLVVPLTLLLPRFNGLGASGVFIAEPISNFVGGTACYVTMLLTIIPELKAKSAAKS